MTISLLEFVKKNILQVLTDSVVDSQYLLVYSNSYLKFSIASPTLESSMVLA